MRSGSISIKSPAIIGLFLVVPFAAAELVSNLIDGTELSGARHLLDMTVLFGLMWVLSATFVYIVMHVVRDVRAGAMLANTTWLVVRVGVLVLIALVWGGLVIDQFPCFMGVPNCD